MQTLITQMGRSHKMGSARVSEAAQRLFVAGHITYPRTDSERIDAAAREKIRAFVTATYGADALGDEGAAGKRGGKKKESVEDAHEAIRPTDIAVTCDQLAAIASDPDCREVYAVVRATVLASQMAPQRTEVATAHFTAPLGQRPEAVEKLRELMGGSGADVDVAHAHVTTTMTANYLVQVGWRAAFDSTRRGTAVALEAVGDEQGGDVGMAEDSSSPGTPAARQRAVEALLALNKGAEVTDKVTATDVFATERKPTPPTLYIEGTLIQELKRHGIGRPSTYPATMKTLLQRGYIEADAATNTLHITTTGQRAADLARRHLPVFVSLEFTKQMEAQLERIVDGTGSADAALSAALNALVRAATSTVRSSFDAATDLSPEERAKYAAAVPNFPVSLAGETPFSQFNQRVRPYVAQNYRGFHKLPDASKPYAPGGKSSAAPVQAERLYKTPPGAGIAAAAAAATAASGGRSRKAPAASPTGASAARRKATAPSASLASPARTPSKAVERPRATSATATSSNADTPWWARKAPQQPAAEPGTTKRKK
jgi:hypothetical protein